MSEEKTQEKRKISPAVLIFLWLGCIIIGTGIGLALHRPDVGGTIGVGCGFFLMGLVIWIFPKK